MTKVAIPWYKSRIIIGAGVSIVSKLLALTGIIDLGDEVVDQIVEGVVIAGGVAGDIVAIHARAVQTEAPLITATKQAAVVVTEAVESKSEQELVEAAAKAASDETGLEVPPWMVR